MNRLSESINIGSMEIRNRTVLAPMTDKFQDADGNVTPRMINYYVARAQGGVGLIIVGDVCVDPIGRGGNIEPCIYHEGFIPGLFELIDQVHLFGAKIAPQIYHAGSDAKQAFNGGKQAVSSSPIHTPDGFIAREMTVKEIEETQNRYVEAAVRAKRAEFDAVQVHGGRLILQFFSSLFNKRTDGYGGSLEKRMRFPLEVVQRIREKVGNNYPLDYKITIGIPGETGRPTLEEAQVLAKKLVEAGISMFHVSVSDHGSLHKIMPPMGVEPEGCFTYLAEAIKKVVDVPVCTVGRIYNPKVAEKILKEGKADLIATGRGLLADSEWPNKAIKGKYEDIRRCIGCNRGCITRLHRGVGLTCSINPSVGREKEFKITHTYNPKKILVIGGGPSGMEFARVAALRGHKVTLYEKTSKLGGQLNLAEVPPYRAEIGYFPRWQARQLQKLDVKVELEKEVTVEFIIEAKPDVVVVATGATPLIPRIPGIDRENVVTSWDVLSGKVCPKNDASIIGGGLTGCETAEYLVEKGCNVTIIEMLDQIATDMESYTKIYFFNRLDKSGIAVMTGHRVEAITEAGILTVDKNKTKHTHEAETIVLAMGTISEKKLLNELKGKGLDVYAVGDCVSPRKLHDAVHEGYAKALQI